MNTTDENRKNEAVKKDQELTNQHDSGNYDEIPYDILSNSSMDAEVDFSMGWDYYDVD
jgi:hypothetical protein